MYKRLLVVLTALSLSIACLTGCGNKYESILSKKGIDVYKIYTGSDLKTNDMFDVAENPKGYIGKIASFLIVPTEHVENSYLTKAVVAKMNPDPLYRGTNCLRSDTSIILDFESENATMNPIVVDESSEDNSMTYSITGEITGVDDGVPIIKVSECTSLSTYSSIVALDYAFKDNPEELDELNIQPLIDTSIYFDYAYEDSDEADKRQEYIDKATEQTNLLSDKISQYMNEKTDGKFDEFSLSKKSFEYFVDKNGDYWITMSSVFNSYNEYYKKAEEESLLISTDDINPILETTVFFLPKDGLESLEGLETKVDYVDPISIIFE